MFDFYQQPWPEPVPMFDLPKNTFTLRFGFDEASEIDKLAVERNEFKIDVEYDGHCVLLQNDIVELKGES